MRGCSCECVKLYPTLTLYIYSVPRPHELNVINFIIIVFHGILKCLQHTKKDVHIRL